MASSSISSKEDIKEKEIASLENIEYANEHPMNDAFTKRTL